MVTKPIRISEKVAFSFIRLSYNFSFMCSFFSIQWYTSFLEKSLLNFPSVSQQRSNVLIVTWVLLHNMSAITLDWMREQSRGWDSSGNHTLRRTWSSTSLEKSWCSCNDINLLLLVQFVLFSSRSQSELKSVTAVCRALWARHTRQWEAQREEQNEMRGGEAYHLEEEANTQLFVHEMMDIFCKGRKREGQMCSLVSSPREKTWSRECK